MKIKRSKFLRKVFYIKWYIERDVQVAELNVELTELQNERPIEDLQEELDEDLQKEVNEDLTKDLKVLEK